MTWEKKNVFVLQIENVKQCPLACNVMSLLIDNFFFIAVLHLPDFNNIFIQYALIGH